MSNPMVEVAYTCRKCGREYTTRREAAQCSRASLLKKFKDGDLVVPVSLYGQRYGVGGILRIVNVYTDGLRTVEPGLVRIADLGAKSAKDKNRAYRDDPCACGFELVGNATIDDYVEKLERQLKAAQKLQAMIHAQNKEGV